MDNHNHKKKIRNGKCIKNYFFRLKFSNFYVMKSIFFVEIFDEFIVYRFLGRQKIGYNHLKK